MNELIIIKDDFLPINTFKSIQESILGSYFPWYFQNMIDYEDELDDFSKYQFIVPTVRYSQVLTNAGLSELNVVLQPFGQEAEILRAKYNLQPWTKRIQKNSFHVDLDKNSITPETYTCIFYINTCNGYTEFENGIKVDSVENRMLIFNPTLMHRGTTTSNSQKRVVLNINIKNINIPENAITLN